MLHARLYLIGLLAACAFPGRGGAQVGYPPDASPYRDMRVSQYLTLTAGYLTGGTGDAGVGPTDGLLGGIRWDIRLSGPAYAHFGVSGGLLERLVIDPTRGVEDRIRDTVRQSVYVADAGLGLVLTGQKTWNGLAPYVAATLGLALGGAVPEDSSGFRFSTRFHIGPQVGVRWHVGERLHLRLEGRDILWRLRYPPGFFSRPAGAPDDPPVLDPEQSKGAQWVHHPTLVLSIGYALRM